MAINLGTNVNLGNMNNNQQQGGLLNLQKGQMLNLTKREPGLKNVVLAAGWDVKQSGMYDFDLDIAAFLLSNRGKVERIPNDVIFFNNMTAQGISLGGDNRTGMGDGDDESIQINLEQVDSSVERIVFSVTIYEAVTRHQTFGMVQNSYVRLLNSDKNNDEICRFNLREEGSSGTSVIFAELIKQNGEWNFKAIGDTKVADLNGLLTLYM